MAADRGGPFGRACRGSRAAFRGARPTHVDCGLPAESSPIGGAARDAAMRCACGDCALALALAPPLASWLATSSPRPSVGQWLLERAWQRTLATGDAGQAVAVGRHASGRAADRAGAARRRDRAVGRDRTHARVGAGPSRRLGARGRRGNAVFTAHRDTHFAFLARAAVGERIIVERATARARLPRQRRRRSSPQRDLHLRADTDAPTLTLVTCYPFDAIAPNTPWRYVVTATLAAPPVMAGAECRRRAPAGLMTRGMDQRSRAERRVNRRNAMRTCPQRAPRSERQRHSPRAATARACRPQIEQASTSDQPATPPMPPQTTMPMRLSQTERIDAFSLGLSEQRGAAAGNRREQRLRPGWRGCVKTSASCRSRRCGRAASPRSRSHTCAATRRSWVMNSIAGRAAARISSSSASTCACTETSSADTGSSAISSSGSIASARAMQMRWRWPPENWCG